MGLLMSWLSMNTQQRRRALVRRDHSSIRERADATVYAIRIVSYSYADICYPLPRQGGDGERGRQGARIERTRRSGDSRKKRPRVAWRGRMQIARDRRVPRFPFLRSRRPSVVKYNLPTPVVNTSR